jgi:hypothetical protein
MKKLLALMCVWAWLAAGGCAAGKTEPPRSARETQDQQVYDLYRQYMEALNKQREQAGLPPVTVRSYKEFRRSPGTE